MIPLMLRLDNFMSYAELELDFSGIHLAVLTGANGAGKSSLLDAITYAIWEKARATPEQLIRLGQGEMWVELTFELEDQTYRVFRRRTRKTGVGSQLEFHQLQGEDWVPLTGTTTRETQAKITQAVRMDYETFINSAFLRQGRADEFTTKTPQERKAVLGEILGLSAYDSLAGRARDKWKAAQAQADGLEHEQLELREALGARDEVDAQVEAARGELDALAERLAEAEAEQAKLQAEGQALQASAERRAALETESAQAEAERTRLEAAMAEAHEAVARAQAAVADRAAVESAYEEWRSLSAQAETWRQGAEMHQSLVRELAAEERLFEQATHQAELTLQTLAADLAALDKEADAHAGVIKERDRIEKAQAVLAAARESEAAHMARVQAARALEAEELALTRRWQQSQLEVEARRRELTARLERARGEAAALPAITQEVQAVAQRVKAFDIASVEQDRVKEKGFQFRARQTQLKEAIARAYAAAGAKAERLQALMADFGTDLAPSDISPSDLTLSSSSPWRGEESREGGEVGVASGRNGRSAGHPHPRLDGSPSPLQGEDPRGQDRHGRVPDGPAREPAIAHCPMCAQDLEGESRARVVAQLRAEVQGHEDEATRLDHELAEVEGLLADSRARFAELATRVKGRDEAQQHLGELHVRLAAAEAAVAEQTRLEAELAAVPDAPEPAELLRVRAELASLGFDPAELSVLQARISDHRWADARGWQLEQAVTALKRLDDRRMPVVTRQAALEAAWHDEQESHEARQRELRAAIAEHATDAEAHAEAQARLATLVDAPAAWTELQHQLLALATAESQLARLEADQAQLELQVARHARMRAELETQLVRHPIWREALTAQEARVAELRADERRRHAELGRLEAEQQRLRGLAERLAEREAAWHEAVADAQAFKELAAAFGKNGIQAILIENVIPELEEDANRLLARMTDNRMHVRLATQKEKKTGGVHETLEIYISDEVGTRNYELYSGGEAFRVNFALRLALSRLLARRAGAKLQTLIIDEGFGTQDERGREKLVEAINAVSDEFARILVITHIRELRDAFNTQIEVVKRGGVSEVRAIA